MNGATSVLQRRVLMLDGTETDVATIRSVMYYPDDGEMRSKFLRWHTVLRDYPDLIAGLDVGPSVDQKSLAKLARQATVAGAVLACYFLLDHFKTTSGVFAHPSLEKAMYVVETLAGHEVVFGDGSKIAAAKRTLRTHWNKFQPVAPFWAAMWLNSGSNLSYPFMEADAQFDHAENVAVFLGVVKSIRLFGVTTVDFLGNPILDDNITWDLPASIVKKTLPKDASESDILVNIMNAYDARIG